MRAAALLIAGLIVLHASAGGQAIKPSPSQRTALRLIVPFRPSRSLREDSLASVAHVMWSVADSIHPSKWRTGMIVGGAVGLVISFSARNGVPCDTGHCGLPLSSWLGITAVCSLVGGLIGSAFH
jgi:hypothetical protein